MATTIRIECPFCGAGVDVPIQGATGRRFRHGRTELVITASEEQLQAHAATHSMEASA